MRLKYLSIKFCSICGTRATRIKGGFITISDEIQCKKYKLHMNSEATSKALLKLIPMIQNLTMLYIMYRLDIYAIITYR